MATREQAKNQRRDAIMDAARTLMQTSGTAGFSMRALAERAGVSIATPYNLFGSKQAIMIAILEREMHGYRAQVDEANGDEIDAIFNAITVATRLYAASPGFYRALLFSIYNDGGTEFRSMFSGRSHAIWEELVERAVAGGHLAQETHLGLFATNLETLFFGNLQAWVHGALGMEDLEIRVHYGFSLALLGLATSSSAGRIREHALAMQTRLWRKAVADRRTTQTDEQSVVTQLAARKG